MSVAHENLIQKWTALALVELPELHLFSRHVGLFYRKNGTPIKINMAGQADQWGIYHTINAPLHFEYEAKVAPDVQSEDQKNYQKFIESLNGLYVCYYSPEEALEKTLLYLRKFNII